MDKYQSQSRRPVAKAAQKAAQAVAEVAKSVANPKRTTWASAGYAV